MKKLILPFFLLLIGAYCGYFLVMENHPPRDPAETNMVLRVNGDGKALDCTVTIYDRDGAEEPLFRSSRETQYLTFIGLADGADLMRINYSVGGGNYVDVDYSLEYEPGVHFKLTVDPVRETVEYDIAYKDYLLGFAISEGPLNLLNYLYRAVMYYILWIIFPLIWLITVYTLFREFRKGLRRRFAGSWAYLVIGGVSVLVVRFATGFFPWLDTWPELLRNAFWLLMLGYPLYFVAYLVLDEDKVLGAEYRLLDEYFTYEEYQLADRRTVNGFVSTWKDRGVGGVLGWLFGAVLLPISTYLRLILYYVTPFLHRSRTWVELDPIEPPTPLGLFEKIPSRFKSYEEPDHEGGADDSDVADEDLSYEYDSGERDSDASLKRRKRKRHRPHRKTPYADSDSGETSQDAQPPADPDEAMPDKESLETWS